MDMKMYVGTFTKKNGDERTMRFVRMQDLPEQFLNSQITGNGTERKLAEGLELVWDVENSGFRVFNWTTAQQPLTSVDVEESKYFGSFLNNTTEVV